MQVCRYTGKENGDCTNVDTYLYQIGIANIEISDKQIVGGTSSSLPSYANQLNSYYYSPTLNEYGGTDGNVGNELTSTELTEQFANNVYSWIETFGFIGAGMACSACGVPLGILQQLIGPIGTSQTSSSANWISSNGPNGYNVYVSAMVSNAEWTIFDQDGNSQDGYVPIGGYSIDAEGGGTGGGCVLNGTLISLSNGTQVPVQSIQPGDFVLSYNTTTGQFVDSIVSSNNNTEVNQVVSIDNGLLYASGLYDQPIYVQMANGTEASIYLGQLQVGMKLFNPLVLNWIPVINIQEVTGNYTVYDLQTQLGHTQNYIANGVIIDVKGD